MSRFARKVCLLAALTAAGCGTIGNLTDRGKIYGGVCRDGKEVCQAGEELIHPPEVPSATAKKNVAILILATLDVPLSAVVDTLTLPMTITLTICNWSKDQPLSNSRNHSECLEVPHQDEPPIEQLPKTIQP